MRKSADWMKPVDDQILECLNSMGNLTPLALSREGEIERVDCGRKYAGMRARELTKYGMAIKIDRGLYQITDKGRAYLNQELDASTLEQVPEGERLVDQ